MFQTKNTKASMVAQVASTSPYSGQTRFILRNRKHCKCSCPWNRLILLSMDYFVFISSWTEVKLLILFFKKSYNKCIRRQCHLRIILFFWSEHWKNVDLLNENCQSLRSMLLVFCWCFWEKVVITDNLNVYWYFLRNICYLVYVKLN